MARVKALIKHAQTQTAIIVYEWTRKKAGRRAIKSNRINNARTF
jgi:hypothetical protein